MRIHHLLIAAAVLATAATADAKPTKRVAILDFEGPRLLADSGHAAVQTVLNDQYDIVSTKRWEAAKMAAAGRGPLQWSTAAKAAGVDAVVEGWIDPEGMRTHTMTIAVRDAMTGRQIDTVSVKITDKGVVSDEATHKLTSGLDELLNWVDDEASTGTKGADWTDIRTMRPPLGSHVDKPEKSASNCDDGDDDDDDDSCDDSRDDDNHHRRKHHRRKHHHVRRGDDDDERDDRRDDRREARDDRRDDRHEDSKRDDSKDDSKHGDDSKHDDSKKDDDKSSTRIATADLPGVDPGVRNIIDIFGPDSVETKTMVDKKGPTLEHPSPKFEMSLGGFMLDRGMSFTQDPPDFPATPPSYPATGMYGLQVQGAWFPMPRDKYGYDLSGFGFTFQLQKSIGAELQANDTVNDTYGSYTLDYTAWEGALHYRYPMGIVTFDGQVNYGSSSYNLESDFPSTVQIPDVAYQYVGIGGDIELAVTDRVRIGFGARYMYILSTGDVSDEEWYGSGTAGGLELNASFKIPLTDMLYLKGIVEYRRVSMDFVGDGNLSTSEDDDSLAVSNITDSSIGASAQIGVSF